jgi:dinuclear metal center YbgI/SA1388 family protein
MDEMAGLDSSLNGIQVSSTKNQITKAAFAVDACMETFDRAIEWGADLLFVHHGLFWGREQRIVGSHYNRIKRLISADMALYAAHLPLDAHPELGNNAGMAAVLELQDREAFGYYHGTKIGVKGRLSEARTTEQIIEGLFTDTTQIIAALPFGNNMIRSVGIISGGAPFEVEQAIEQGLDLYITGDANHIVYHRCLEAGINVIFAGHYATEVFGPRLMMALAEKELGLKTQFIHVPTGL